MSRTRSRTHVPQLLRKIKNAQKMATILDCKVSGQFYMPVFVLARACVGSWKARTSESGRFITQEFTARQK